MKESYFKQAIANMKEANSRFDKPMQFEIDFGEEKTDWVPVEIEEV